MDSDTARIAGPLVIFAAVVTVLLYFWPRPAKTLLEPSRQRKRVQVLDVVQVSHDTKRIRLSTGHKNTILGLPVGKHMQVYAPNPSLSSGTWNGQPDKDGKQAEIARKYTPVTGDETPGYVDLVIKIYKPGTVKMPDGKETTWADGGKVSLYLDSKKPGDEIEVNGPYGMIEYLNHGLFKLGSSRTEQVSHVGMMAGGTGITPMLQIVRHALNTNGDRCKFSLIYANKTEDDILCKELLEEAVANSEGRFKLYFSLDFPPPNWKDKVGFITADMIKECLPEPELKPLMLMCGPPPMVEHACKKNLDTLGYPKNMMMAF